MNHRTDWANFDSKLTHFGLNFEQALARPNIDRVFLGPWICWDFRSIMIYIHIQRRYFRMSQSSFSFWFDSDLNWCISWVLYLQSQAPYVHCFGTSKKRNDVSFNQKLTSTRQQVESFGSLTMLRETIGFKPWANWRKPIPANKNLVAQAQAGWRSWLMGQRFITNITSLWQLLHRPDCRGWKKRSVWGIWGCP